MASVGKSSSTQCIDRYVLGGEMSSRSEEYRGSSVESALEQHSSPRHAGIVSEHAM